MKFKFNGFTLAEVLIALVIIGVIAAITVPTVFSTTQKEEYIVKLKKANSIMKQSLYKISLKYGEPVGIYDYYYDTNFINEFEKTVSVIKKCYTFNSCFGRNYVMLNKQPFSPGQGNSIITSDNIMYSYSQEISDIYGLTEEDKTNTIGRIIVDVNGKKKPNKLGVDTFIFYLVDGRGIVPAGDAGYENCESRSDTGFDCAARVLSEDAINY